jgi:hypothetical protein
MKTAKNWEEIEAAIKDGHKVTEGDSLYEIRLHLDSRIQSALIVYPPNDYCIGLFYRDQKTTGYSPESFLIHA